MAVTSVRTKVDNGGRIVLPAEFRRALDLHPGDPVVLMLDDGEVRVRTLRQAVKRLQEFVRSYIPEGRSLSDELIAERRAESQRE
jgi:AbrB family looped-hinge helix DNA binding protein